MSNKINIPEGWKNVNGEAIVSSVKIAEDFEKEHAHVCRDIQNLISQNPILDSDKYFIETSYKAGTAKNYKAYDVKRKGFSLLTMGFTGSAALEWKLKYIDTFDQMETALRKIAGQTLPSDSSNKSYAPKASSLGDVASSLGLAVAGIAALVKHLGTSSVSTTEWSSNVSTSTQKAVDSFNTLKQKVDTDLKTLAATGKSVTATMAADIKTNVDKMAEQTIAAFDKQKTESIKSIKDLAENSNLITKDEANKMVLSVQSSYDKRIANEKSYQTQIDKIISDASSQKRSLTSQETSEIENLESKMYSDGISALSKNQLEEKAIYEKAKADKEAITAEEAASIVKSSKTTTDKVVADANTKYTSVVEDITKERDETKSISADEANQLIKAAKQQRDESVTAAEDQHDKVVAAVKKQSQEVIENVDWENGEIKTKGQVLSDNIKQTLDDNQSAVQTSVQKTISDTTASFDSFKKSPIQWDKDMLSNLGAGIESKISWLKSTALTDVGAAIKAILGHSVPSEGPLADELTWMPDMVQNFANGINSSKSKVTDQISTIATNISDIISSLPAKALQWGADLINGLRNTPAVFCKEFENVLTQEYILGCLYRSCYLQQTRQTRKSSSTVLTKCRWIIHLELIFQKVR